MHASYIGSKSHRDILSPLPRLCSPSTLSLDSKTLLDGGLERLGVCADDLLDLLLVLEEQEGGHGADAEVLSDVRDLVDVELVEARVGVRVGEPGGGGSAGAGAQGEGGGRRT